MRKHSDVYDFPQASRWQWWDGREGLKAIFSRKCEGVYTNRYICNNEQGGHTKVSSLLKRAEQKANWIDRPVGGQDFLADSSQYPKKILKKTPAWAWSISWTKVMLNGQPILMYGRVTSIMSVSLCMTTCTVSLTNFTALLPQSCECSCYVSM